MLGFLDKKSNQVSFARISQERRKTKTKLSLGFYKREKDQPKTNITIFTRDYGRITPDKKKIQKFDSAILLPSNKQAKQNPTSPARDTLALHKPKTKPNAGESKRMKRNEE